MSALFDEPAQKGATASVDRERQVIALRCAAPLRRPVPQHDESDLALFGVVDTPRLL